MQADHRDHAAPAQLRQDLTIVLDLRLVEFALGRLHARPLDGQPVDAVVQLLKNPEVVPEAVVVIAGRIGGVPGPDAPTLLELPPVTVVIAPFDLVGGRRAAPEKPLWKAPLRRHSLVWLGGRRSGRGAGRL